MLHIAMTHQVFNCLYAVTSNAQGGESIMVDGFKIADVIKREHKDLFYILSTVEVPGNYVGDGVFLESKRLIFKLNSNKEIVQVSFNNYDRVCLG